MVQIEMRRCGGNGLTVTKLGLGGAALGRGPVSVSADENAARTLEAAWRLGIRHLDTSPGYGESERRLGYALGDGSYPGLTVSTKVGTHPERKFSYIAGDIRWSLENSLRVLGLDFVDIALIHDPPAIELALQSGDGFAALRRLREEGLCRNVGLGVHSHDFHRRAIDAGAVDVILTYGDFNIVRRNGVELMRYAKENGVGVLLGSPMMHGVLATGRDPAEQFAARPSLANWYTARDCDVARDWYLWCREREVSMRHLNMRFVMQTDLADCVLTGAANVEEIDTNVREATTGIPDDVWVEALARIERLDWTDDKATS